MIKEIILTPLAERCLENVVIYLTNEWGVATANDFVERVEEVYKFLALSPTIYPFVNKSTRVQRCILTKHNILYFKEYQNRIMIVDVFDTRQNPKKLSGRF